MSDLEVYATNIKHRNVAQLYYGHTVRPNIFHNS